MTVPPKVVELVELFDRDLDLYKRAGYKEAHVRIDFIDPFFEALGWDVRNVQGQREHSKDVIHEDAITVAGKIRAPDYSFRIGGARRFFLEAKKPSVSLKGDVGPAFQLRRYSWSVKLPLGILTDFEEFAVYDCRRCPRASDKASVGRLMYFTFDQYLDRFDEIHSMFAKEWVQQGSLDHYAQAIKGKRGTSEVDAELLKEIEGWRDALARNIALRNKDLSVHELNFAVQRTIDRIIFLRMCEDRGIEDYAQLLALTNGPHIYARLGDYYRRADEKYNAGLFDFRTDTLTRTLVIDDKVLKPILVGLYYPRCPYEFSVLPVEMLGQVYEQFLGKVIRLTPAHRAKVEEKPEVKKAGGVYYTPSYIVDYIVRQTVGQLIAGKTPRQISKLRILDPACGSGSFLLGAYQYLLDYHLRWYEDHDPAKHAQRKQPAVYQGQRGEWRLTGAEKKRILLNNIYGVDIDQQAVEVTKLSLLLQVLEGETDETLGQQLSLWRERALPDLGSNIKCGNSLIGPDYFESQLMPDEAEMRWVNPFDWKAEFPKIMAAGGFDAVIGNPPYVEFKRLDQRIKAMLSVEGYKTISGKYDIYIPFVERSVQLLKQGGLLGFIMPSMFTKRHYGKALRRLLSEQAPPVDIVDFSDFQVFKGATNYVGTFIFERNSTTVHECRCRILSQGRNSDPLVLQADLFDDRENGSFKQFSVDTDDLGEDAWALVPTEKSRIRKRLTQHIQCKSLAEVTEAIWQGIASGKDQVFYLSEIQCEELGIEDGVTLPLLKGRDIRRWRIDPREEYRVLYAYDSSSAMSCQSRNYGKDSPAHTSTLRSVAHCLPVERTSRNPGRSGLSCGVHVTQVVSWHQSWSAQRSLRAIASHTTMGGTHSTLRSMVSERALGKTMRTCLDCSTRRCSTSCTGWMRPERRAATLLTRPSF